VQGPMARTVAETAEMLRHLAPGFEPRPPVELAELRIAVAWLDPSESLTRHDS